MRDFRWGRALRGGGALGGNRFHQTVKDPPPGNFSANGIFATSSPAFTCERSSQRLPRPKHISVPEFSCVLACRASVARGRPSDARKTVS